MRAVVTGANRGIGLEFVRQLLARGDRVVAAVREPKKADRLRDLAAGERLEIVACDVSSDASVAELDSKLAPGPVDTLINNAGIIGQHGRFPSLDYEDCIRVFSTNALGALRVSTALLDRLRKGSSPRIVNISTGMASLADNGSGGAWAYRMSKAALNMATVNLGLALGGDGITCIAVNPGWVQTDMGGAGANMPVDESVRRLLAIHDGLTLEKSGSFLNHDGSVFPW